MDALTSRVVVMVTFRQTINPECTLRAVKRVIGYLRWAGGNRPTCALLGAQQRRASKTIMAALAWLRLTVTNVKNKKTSVANCRLSFTIQLVVNEIKTKWEVCTNFQQKGIKVTHEVLTKLSC